MTVGKNRKRAKFFQGDLIDEFFSAASARAAARRAPNNSLLSLSSDPLAQHIQSERLAKTFIQLSIIQWAGAGTKAPPRAPSGKEAARLREEEKTKEQPIARVRKTGSSRARACWTRTGA